MMPREPFCGPNFLTCLRRGGSTTVLTLTLSREVEYPSRTKIPRMLLGGTGRKLTVTMALTEWKQLPHHY